MKIKFTIAILLICTFLSAQAKFEKGYYIDLNGTKNEGYIKNSDWKSSPKEIIFKANLEDNDQVILSEKISEFEIQDKLKFKRFNIDIERSTTKTSLLYTNKKTPIFNNENLLLKVLVEGKASLYYYYDTGIEKFFYATNSKPIEQLIYIPYLADKEDYDSYKKQGIDNVVINSTILYNNTFKKQLNENVNCNSSRKQLSNMKFNSSSLKKYFISYNECENAAYNKFIYGNKSTLKLKASLINNLHSINIVNSGEAAYSKKFSNSHSFGFGF